jgi:transposase
MRYCQPQEQCQYFCGVDLHTKTMYLCVQDEAGRVQLHKNIRARPEAFLKAIDYLEGAIKCLEAYLVRRTKVHDAQNFHRLRTVPGIEQVLAMTLLYEIEDIGRFSRVQQVVSHARLVKGQKSSAGKKLGTQGGRMGNRHLKWAFSEASILFLRESDRARNWVARREAKYGKGKTL